MTKLFITADQVKQTTSISGTTDSGLISQKIYYAQITDILRILGQELYDKIYNDLSIATPLTGEYLYIYEKYLIDLHVFFTAHYFTLFNEVKQSNIGNTTPAQNYGNTIDLAEQYKALGVSVETNFRKYMETSTIAEWDRCSTETNLNGFY